MLIISYFSPHNNRRLPRKTSLKDEITKSIRFRPSFSELCPFRSYIFTISLRLIPTLLSFIHGFQQPDICNDSAKSQEGVTKGASRRSPPPQWGAAGGSGGRQTTYTLLLDTPILYTLLPFHSKKLKEAVFCLISAKMPLITF